ncbi:aldehyde dehydrogenase family protein [Clostridium chromiireducens]|uniref:Aldehyde dehydrogenase n=2 Tax=Clostridium chromiireducens TaxID=225345 RepID=A0A964W132_9CLOT|nr:aldehyde dehydrogenase [Clostridium chromiireducens]MVX62740.1 aldehyde dehydrogenase family protein [Clostridium chromiireducens]
MGVKELINKQIEFFQRGEQLDINFRRDILIKLKKIIKDNEQYIIDALKKDLHKSDFESYLTEISMVYEEINTHLKSIRKWSKRRSIKSSIMFFPSKTYIEKQPYGTVLIIGPFNYPFQLVILPLVGAISAGNTVIIKPSESAVNTSCLIERIINDNFDEEYIKVVGADKGKECVEELLEQEFDYIFFTGSIRVGKIIMEKAAKRLIPVTLELGGKSPCIIDKGANLKMAAKRIVWGKLLNAGQTCVAPDYLFVHNEVKEKLLDLIVKEIKFQYGHNIRECDDFPRIINKRELERLSQYLNEGNIYYGGNYDEKSLFFEPTILTDLDEKAKVLEEEIFGPILPVMTFDNLKEVIQYVNNKSKPLALYYFSEDENNIKRIIKETSSGGVTINDTILHVGTPNLPFGGVGTSGMGAYHGKHSFDTFTHEKSIVRRGTYMEFPFRFAPFKNKINLLRRIIK